MSTKPTDQYGPKEAQERFETVLRGAMNTPHKPNEELKLGKSKAKPKSGSHQIPKLGRKPLGKRAMTQAESTAKYRSERRKSGFKTVAEELADTKSAPTTSDKPKK